MISKGGKCGGAEAAELDDRLLGAVGASSRCMLMELELMRASMPQAARAPTPVGHSGPSLVA